MLTRRNLTLGSIAALAAPAVLSRRAQAAEFNWKFATNAPPPHPTNIRAQEAIDRIKEQSKGRINITLFPNNQLGGDTDMFSQIRAGAIHLFPISGLIIQTVVPEAGANGVGFAFKDYDTVWSAMDGDFGALIRTKIASAGIQAFPKIWDNGFRQTTSSRNPIRAPDDLAGFKIRLPVMPILSSLFESLGAAPTTINIKEAYSALQTRLVDGLDNPLALIDSWKFYEVQKYCSLTNHIWDGLWVLANSRAMNRLPPDLQEVVSQNINQAGIDQRADLAKLSNTLQAQLEKSGLVFNQPDTAPFRAKLSASGFYKHWEGSFGPELWASLEKYTGKLA